MTTNTNMANLEAANLQHILFAIGPRLARADEKLNEQLVPRHDPSGRLFLASEDPTPGDQDAMLAENADIPPARRQSARPCAGDRSACSYNENDYR
jgi:hypothetical protein